MIRLLFLLTFTLICNACKTPAKIITEPKIKFYLSKMNFDWMLGTWKKIDVDSSKHFEEWKKKNRWDYRGTAFKVNNSDTFTEDKMRLSYRNKSWSYDIINEKNKLTKNFPLHGYGGLGFFAYNYQKDTAVIINYTTNLNNDSLYTEIDFGGKQEKFIFKKVN